MKKILFFDDDKFITEYLIRNLKENWGWDTANNREITLITDTDEMLKEIYTGSKSDRKYDLFILDIMAPLPSEGNEHITKKDREAMDRLNTGIVIARKIREQERYKDVPIIYLSAKRITDIDSIKGDSYFRKPVSARELSGEMEALLN